MALTILRSRQFLRDYPDYGPAWLLLGIALIETARYEEAEQSLVKAIELAPPNKRHIPRWHLGHLFRSCGDYEQAARHFQRAIESEPTDATGHIFLGAVLAQQGRFHEAERVFREATRCSDGCIDEAYMNLGNVLRALERFEQAAECYREAIRIDPEYRLAKQALRDVTRCIPLKRPRRKRS